MRTGSDYPRGRLKNLWAPDLEAAPRTESMGGRYAHKWFNENLRPLVRFLSANVGRPWDKVRSEIGAHVSCRSAVQKHVLDHLRDSIPSGGRTTPRSPGQGLTNVQTAMSLASYSDPKTHMRYVMAAEAAKPVPAAALPVIDPALAARLLSPAVTNDIESTLENQMHMVDFIERYTGLETATFGLGSQRHQISSYDAQDPEPATPLPAPDSTGPKQSSRRSQRFSAADLSFATTGLSVQ